MRPITQPGGSVDRSGWGPGPWDGEEDLSLWRDEATGLWCLARRTMFGHFCGYVAVMAGHPLYEATEPGDLFDERLAGLEVHGGITFVGHLDDEAWWLGFDCQHPSDYSPGLVAEMRAALGYEPSPLLTGGTYRTLGYVRAECLLLAAQLGAMR